MSENLTPHALSAALWLGMLGTERSVPCLAQILRAEPQDVAHGLEQLSRQGIVRRNANRWATADFPRARRLRFAQLLEDAEASPQARCILLLTREEGALDAYMELQALIESLITSSATKGASACLRLLIDGLRGRRIRDNDTPELRTFIDLVLMAQSNAFYLGACMAEARQLSERAAAAARLLGDARTLALTRLIEGCLGSLSGQAHGDPVAALRQGVDAINSMGDSDILEQASHFLSLLHYVQGDFRGTFRHFEAAQHCAPMFKCRYFMEMFPIYMVPSSLYMGFAPLALGMAQAALADAAAAGNAHGVLWWHILLAVVFLRLGLPQRALPHLDRVLPHADAESNPKLHLWAFRTLAYYHAHNGNLEAAHRILRRGFEEHRPPGLRFAYTAPWILELLFLLEEHGLDPLPGYSVDEECARVLREPNRHLHGAAYRIQAHRLQRRGGAPQDVAALLRKSAECFTAAENREEAALSTQMLAALTSGADTPAWREARDVLEESALREAALPATRPRALPWRGWRAGGGDNARAHAVRACMEDLDRLEPTLPLRHVFSRIINILQRRLGAERALLLRRCPLEGWTLEYGANCSAQAFARRRRVITARLSAPAPEAERFSLTADHRGVSLRLRIALEEERSLHLLLESGTVAGHFVSLTEEENLLLARRVGAELRTALKIEAARRAEMRSQQAYLAAALEEKSPAIRFDNGRGLRAVLEQARYAALSDAPILILGETGVGKEVLARRIHQFSGRKGPFVPVMPASTPETLFESEFFGYEKGAFTGAVKQKIGLFELANNGTFFIDEVGELPLTFQTKLLRVLQEKKFMRVGGTRAIASDFRLLTATNRDLWSEVQNGNFREDLYYRISIIPITIPPLRQRPEDIPGLAQMFVDELAERYRKSLPPLSRDELQTLMAYHWPGNVRELKNVVERAVILSAEQGLRFSFGPGQLPETRHTGPEGLYADLPTLEDLCVRYMRHVLEHTGGQIIGPDGAERILGMKRSTLYAKLRQYGLR